MKTILRNWAAEARNQSRQSSDWLIAVELEGRAIGFLDLADHPVPGGIRRAIARLAFRQAEFRRLNGDSLRQRFYNGYGAAFVHAANVLS